MKIKAELTFPPTLKDQPVIYNLCRESAAHFNILEASFSTDTGWAILVFDGSQEEIDKTLEFLKDKGVKIETSQL
ncbi:NIL domain-containing protein [Candidatus Omnitrophota bacterium]